MPRRNPERVARRSNASMRRPTRSETTDLDNRGLVAAPPLAGEVRDGHDQERRRAGDDQCGGDRGLDGLLALPYHLLERRLEVVARDGPAVRAHAHRSFPPCLGGPCDPVTALRADVAVR